MPSSTNTKKTNNSAKTANSAKKNNTANSPRLPAFLKTYEQKCTSTINGAMKTDTEMYLKVSGKKVDGSITVKQGDKVLLTKPIKSAKDLKALANKF